MVDAARFGERVFNCVQGIHSTEVLASVGKSDLAGKILIDWSNPYLYDGRHISLDPRWSGHTSLGEANQALLPETEVVKTLNYLCHHLMTHPGLLPEAGANQIPKNHPHRLLCDRGDRIIQIRTQLRAFVSDFQ